MIPASPAQVQKSTTVTPVVLKRSTASSLYQQMAVIVVISNVLTTCSSILELGTEAVRTVMSLVIALLAALALAATLATSQAQRIVLNVNQVVSGVFVMTVNLFANAKTNTLN